LHAQPLAGPLPIDTQPPELRRRLSPSTDACE
jgi:hypothetical protein